MDNLKGSSSEKNVVQSSPNLEYQNASQKTLSKAHLRSFSGLILPSSVQNLDTQVLNDKLNLKAHKNAILVGTKLRSIIEKMPSQEEDENDGELRLFN